jgi:hypothetical protein
MRSCQATSLKPLPQPVLIPVALGRPSEGRRAAITVRRGAPKGAEPMAFAWRCGSVEARGSQLAAPAMTAVAKQVPSISGTAKTDRFIVTTASEGYDDALGRDAVLCRCAGLSRGRVGYKYACAADGLVIGGCIDSHRGFMNGEVHIVGALRLLLVQTVGGLAIGGVLAGALVASTHLGLSGALFVAGIVVALVGIGWSLGGPKRAVPWTLGTARMDDPVSISRRPIGTSQADAVLVVSSILTGLLLAASAVIAR